MQEQLIQDLEKKVLHYSIHDSYLETGKYLLDTRAESASAKAESCC